MAQSGSDERLELEGIKLERGSRVTQRIPALELADGSRVELPLIVVRGRKPGPVFYLGAAFHGDEVNSVEIATRFASELDPGELRGTLLVVPVQNPMAFQIQHRYFVGHMLKSPLDQSPADPWVSFPGDANGNIASLLSHTLFTRVMQQADYLIDIHTPTTGGRYAPFAFLPPARVGGVVSECEALAGAFGADFVLAADKGVYVLDESPHVVMARRGAIAMGVEVGEGGRLESEVTERGLQGLRNAFSHIGMLNGERSTFGRRMVISSMTVIRAHRGGLLHRSVGLNDEVKEGQVVATVTNTFGEVVEEIQAPHSGPVVRIATFPTVSAGERVAQLGVPR